MIIPDRDGSSEGPVKLSMDYMYLHERSGASGDTTDNPPHLVIVEHRHGRLWAYRVPNKGVMGEAEWLPKKVIQDLNNNGMQNLTWHVKADQEPFNCGTTERITSRVSKSNHTNEQSRRGICLQW